MKVHYQYLSLAERSLIQTQLSMGWSPAAIAAGLQRARSTVLREIRRNRWDPKKTQRKRGRPYVAAGYYAVTADQRARWLRQKPCVERKLVAGTPIWDRIPRLITSEDGAP